MPPLEMQTNTHHTRTNKHSPSSRIQKLTIAIRRNKQHKQTEGTTMHIFQLQSLLNIPAEGLAIVVDNASSPQQSVSLRTQPRRRKRHRRTSSADTYAESCRCSAIPPPRLVNSEDAMYSCRAGSFLRTCAVDEMDSCSTSTSIPFQDAGRR